MSGQYYAIGEADVRFGWRFAVLAVAACASAALVLAAAPRAFSENYVSVNSRVQSARPLAMLSAPITGRHQAQENPLPAASDYVLAPEVNRSSQAFGLTLIAGGAALVLGAAFSYAQQLLGGSKPAVSPQSQCISMHSTAGEKEAMRQLVASLDAADMRVLSRGGSMADVATNKGIDEVAQAIRSEQLSRKDLTPKDVILEMQRGNGRFWMGLSERPDMDAMSRRALIMAQAPKICILSCSDSRVPVEIIFDQGLGEVFVVRMAGNILDANAHGSIEYAVKYLGVKVILVIGHEGCGAVKGAIGMSPEDIAKEPFDLQVVLQSIRGGLDVKELNGITDVRSREREAIVLNTSNQVKKLQQNQLIAEKTADGSLLVAGAFYEISSGIVDFFSLDKNGLVIDI